MTEVADPMVGPADLAPDTFSYQDFGVRFFERAATGERILGVLSGMLAAPIRVGPMGAGPGRLAKVEASGAYGKPAITQIDTEPIQFRLVVPVAVDFTLDLGLSPLRFKADLVVPFVLTARAEPDLQVVIDVRPPKPSELTIKVHAAGLQAKVVQKVADVDYELRMFLARYIERELTKPYIEQARHIDVAIHMDRIMPAATPGSGPAPQQ
jgi:hypothetical protein